MADKYGAAEGGLMDVEPKRRKRDPKKAHLHKMEVERGHGKKGYIAHHIEHRHDDGTMEHEHPDQGAKFPLQDMDALNQHMGEHMGEGESPAEEGGESPDVQAGEQEPGE